MTVPSRVAAATSTHSQGTVKQGSSESKVTNHQDVMTLIDPEDVDSGNTHSEKTPKTTGPKKAPTTAAVRDEEIPAGGKTAQIPNEQDPSAGYLETESGMPVIDNSLEAESEAPAVEEPLEGEEGVEVTEELLEEDDDLEAEFEDLGDLDAGGDLEAEFEDDSDDFDDLGDPEVESDPEPELEAEADEPEALPFEEDVADADGIALVDADALDDGAVDDLAFATTANAVHVIHSNRIIASMGPASARKVKMEDVYMSDQFHTAVQANVEARGLRKGLVQSGFVLAKVKLAAASKATHRAIEAKVNARIEAKVATMAKRDQALEQSLAIAAVGINRRYFKDAKNELRSGLEAELTAAGVRGASRIVQAAFQRYGVDYAKAILTLANRIAAMPEDVRDHYASALDLTDDSEFVDSAAEDEDMDEDFDDMDDGTEVVPDTVTAALMSPARRSHQTAALLKAGVKTTAAMSILAGDGSLV
jgi:hypothetical protein